MTHRDDEDENGVAEAFDAVKKAAEPVVEGASKEAKASEPVVEGASKEPTQGGESASKEANADLRFRFLLEGASKEAKKLRKVRKTDSAEVIAAAMEEPMAKKIAKARAKAAKQPAKKPERVVKRVSKEPKPVKVRGKPNRALPKAKAVKAKPAKRVKIAQPEAKVVKTMERSYIRRGRISEGTTIIGGAMQATCTFPPKMFAKLSRAAKADGVSLSEAVRQCVQRALG